MLNALLASLVATTSVAAPCEQPVAKPVAVYRQPEARVTWHKPITLLAKDVTFAKGGRAKISVDDRKFDKLTITAESGRTVVDQVVVKFDDGTQSVFRNLDKTLAPQQAMSLSVDDCKGITAVIVNGQGSNYFRHAADFNLTAV